jgi:hypothetical protein
MSEPDFTEEQTRLLSNAIVDRLMAMRPEQVADPVLAILKAMASELSRTNRTLDAILDALSR